MAGRQTPQAVLQQGIQEVLKLKVLGSVEDERAIAGVNVRDGADLLGQGVARDIDDRLGVLGVDHDQSSLERHSAVSRATLTRRRRPTLIRGRLPCWSCPRMVSGLKPDNSENRSMVISGTVAGTWGALLVSMSYLLVLAGCGMFKSSNLGKPKWGRLVAD